MNIFAQATRQKLRFDTGKGLLSVEQLWDISYTRLGNIVRNLNTKIKSQGNDELDFLDDTKIAIDSTLQLMFDVAKEVYIIRKEERFAAKAAQDNREKINRLSEILAQKQAQKELEMSEEEILAQINALKNATT